MGTNSPPDSPPIPPSEPPAFGFRPVVVEEVESPVRRDLAYEGGPDLPFATPSFLAGAQGAVPPPRRFAPGAGASGRRRRDDATFKGRARGGPVVDSILALDRTPAGSIVTLERMLQNQRAKEVGSPQQLPLRDDEK